AADHGARRRADRGGRHARARSRHADHAVGARPRVRARDRAGRSGGAGRADGKVLLRELFFGSAVRVGALAGARRRRLAPRGARGKGARAPDRMRRTADARPHAPAPAPTARCGPEIARPAARRADRPRNRMTTSPSQGAPARATLDPEETLLVARARAGDRAAFGELIVRHQDVVWGLAWRLTRGRRAQAEDLAQESFVRALQGIANFRGDAAFGTWMHRIVLNLHINRTSTLAARAERRSIPV